MRLLDRIGRGLGEVLVERLVLVDVDRFRAVLAENVRGGFGAGAQRDRGNVAEVAGAGQDLRGGWVQLPFRELCDDEDLGHLRSPSRRRGP